MTSLWKWEDTSFMKKQQRIQYLDFFKTIDQQLVSAEAFRRKV